MIEKENKKFDAREEKAKTCSFCPKDSVERCGISTCRDGICDDHNIDGYCPFCAKHNIKEQLWAESEEDERLEIEREKNEKSWHEY